METFSDVFFPVFGEREIYNTTARFRGADYSTVNRVLTLFYFGLRPEVRVMNETYNTMLYRKRRTVSDAAQNQEGERSQSR